MKRQVFPIIGTIITKRSSSVVVRTIFCHAFSVRASDKGLFMVFWAEVERRTSHLTNLKP